MILLPGGSSFTRGHAVCPSHQPEKSFPAVHRGTHDSPPGADVQSAGHRQSFAAAEGASPPPPPEPLDLCVEVTLWGHLCVAVSSHPRDLTSYVVLTVLPLPGSHCPMSSRKPPRSFLEPENVGIGRDRNLTSYVTSEWPHGWLVAKLILQFRSLHS